MHPLQVIHLGLIDYATGLQLQETLVELRKQGRIADTLLLLEHPPVITLGRNSKAANIVAPPELLAQRGIEVHEINRGGDVTIHAPGQLVGYPIIDLRGHTPKLGAVEYVRKLEEVLIRTCAEYGIAAQRIPGLTGVWTQGKSERAPAARAQAEPQHAERKIAAIGVHISRGVTSHGFALNVSTDLDFFNLIVPCGIIGKEVTSIERELVGRQQAKPLDMESVAQVFTRQFGNVFGTQILWLESLDALLTAGSANHDVPLRVPDDLQKLRDELTGTSRDDISFSV